jgi:hypothetical protein
MNTNENAIETGEVASPDEAEMLGAFDEDAVSDDVAIAAANDPAVSPRDALVGLLAVPSAQ